jgi:hypothetical protein
VFCLIIQAQRTVVKFMTMRCFLACFLFGHAASFKNEDHRHVDQVEVEVSSHGVQTPRKVKRARKESTIPSKQNDFDVLARSEKSKSDQAPTQAASVALAAHLAALATTGTTTVASLQVAPATLGTTTGAPQQVQAQNTFQTAAAPQLGSPKVGAPKPQFAAPQFGGLSVQGVNGVQSTGGQGPFTAADLQQMTTPNDPNSCYIGLFDGPDANSPGGVYLISPAWFTAHPGGTFAGQPWCGTPRFGWTQVNPSHQNFATSLQNDANFVQAGQIIATYMGEFSAGGQGPFTAADLQQMTTPNDENSCYIGLFDGPDANAPGGVYLISPAWFTAHPGGTFANQPWCGSPRFGWTQVNPSHQNFATALQDDANLVQAGEIIATYMGEFSDDGQGPFTAADLQQMTTPNDPNSCYIGLFDGPEANSPGGVYLISPAWFTAHPGGTFANQPWCGTPRFGWTQVNPSHQSFATALQNDADFVQAGEIIATYMGEFSDGAQADQAANDVGVQQGSGQMHARASLVVSLATAGSLYFLLGQQ